MLSQDQAFFDRVGSGEIVTKVSRDIDLVRTGMGDRLGYLIWGIAANTSVGPECPARFSINGAGLRVGPGTRNETGGSSASSSADRHWFICGPRILGGGCVRSGLRDGRKGIILHRADHLVGPRRPVVQHVATSHCSPGARATQPSPSPLPSKSSCQGLGAGLGLRRGLHRVLGMLLVRRHRGHPGDVGRGCSHRESWRSRQC